MCLLVVYMDMGGVRVVGLAFVCGSISYFKCLCNRDRFV